jgi:hypothetical protein
MIGCDPATAAAKLDMAMESLAGVIEETRSQWDDDMGRGFDAQYLAPLEPKVRRALDAIRHLADSLARAERECS